MSVVKAYQKVNKFEQLGQYNLSKFPNTGDYYGPLYDDNLRRYLTGLDENDPIVLRIPDKKERETRQAEIIETRQRLEALIGTDLTYKNEPFWNGYLIPMVVNMRGDVRTFDADVNPLDELALIVLKRRGEIPMSKAEMHDPRYKNAKFYLTTDVEETSFNKVKIRADRKRGNLMTELFDSESANYDRAWNIAFYLGLKPKKGQSFDKLEEDLELFTTVGNELENSLEKFFDAMKLSNEDLIVANSIKRAYSYGIIKYNKTDKLYYRGGLNFRPTIEESIVYLKTPELSSELTDIITKVKKYEATKKNIAG